MRVLAFPAGLALLLCAASALALPPEEETEHVVAPGETLYGIASRAEVPSETIVEANGLKPPYIVRIGQKLKIPRASKPAAISGAAPEIETEHLVRPGETLGGIALRAKVPRVLIAEANGLTPPFNVRAGQKLIIPRTRHHTVKDGETGFAIAYRYGVAWADIAVANGIGEGDTLRTGQKLLIPTRIDRPDPAPTASPAPAVTQPARFVWPVTGPIRRGFQERGAGDYHNGIDITAPEGAAVRAADAGTVIFARKDKEQFGNLVVVDHGDGWASAYGSLGRITVKTGHKVAKGERVGLVGDTSITRQTELHFELRRGGKAVDPLTELPKAQEN